MTVAVVIVWRSVNWLLVGAAPIISAELAGKQFENSDASYMISRGAGFFTGSGMSVLFLLIALVAIWWKPLKGMFAVAVAIVLVTAPCAHAYYEKSDYAEAYFVLPNESAFYLPDVGANKDSQTAFGSEAYLKENKIAAKRFLIPHTKLENSGLFSNYYVPAGRLIIVDRTPYNREWVSAEDRGTSAGNQSFPCQSQDGLDITVGIAIGTSLLEENAPRYLYRFGIKAPTGDRTDPDVIFTSVLHSRSLEEAMDGVVRNNIQTLVCEEFSHRSFEDGSKEASTIMTEVRKSVTIYLTSVGITLDFIGWADTFKFDPVVQAAINDRYAAEKIAPVMATLQTKAILDALNRWNGRLPNTVLFPPDVLTGMAGAIKAVGASAPTPKQ